MESSTEDTDDEVIRIRLRKQLEQSGMSVAVRKMVRQICNAKDNVDEINPDEVIHEVYKRGLINGLMDDFEKCPGPDRHCQNLESTGFLETLSHHHSHRTKSKEYLSEFENDDSSSGEDDVIEKTLRKSGKYYVKVEVKGGKSFLDHVLEDDQDLIPSHPDLDELQALRKERLILESRSKLKLHVFYKSRRFTSKAEECCCDPSFKEVFLIEIERLDSSNESGSIVDQLLNINEPLRFMIVREDVNSQHSVGGSLIGHCLYDWRSLVLIAQNGVKSFPLELMGIGPQHNICVGILQLRCSLIPLPSKGSIESSEYLDKVNDEKASQEDSDRVFVAEAKRWWREYMEIRSEHQLRLIRIFAYDEKMTARPVMTFVKPVVVDDLLVTPFQASWFVSLLPTNENKRDVISPHQENDGGGLLVKDWILPGIQNGIGGCLLSERWQNIDETIISKSGTVEDHAVLLTSLLLTFGLDAFVALGTKKGKGSWAWTITMSEKQEPTFWESTSGEYYEHYSYPEGMMQSRDRLPSDVLKRLAKNKMYGFLTVSCVFNNKGLYGNVQPTTSVDYLDWNLSNPSKWKHLPLTDTGNVGVSLCPTKMMRPVLNWDFISRKMEFSLRHFICLARKEGGLSTKWDDHFEQFMGQHLVREEMEVSTGGKDFKDFFRTVALKSLPPGYDLRAKSFHSPTTEAQAMFDLLIREPLMEGIILARGVDVKHSMKVKIFPYPEDVPSIRFILACKYIPTG